MLKITIIQTRIPIMTKNNKNQHAQELGKLGAASRWASHKPLTEEEKKARHAAAQKRYRDKKRKIKF